MLQDSARTNEQNLDVVLTKLQGCGLLLGAAGCILKSPRRMTSTPPATHSTNREGEKLCMTYWGTRGYSWQ